MSCTNPIYAVNLGNKLNDKGEKVQNVKILGLHLEDSIASLKMRYGDSLLTLPCGKCLSCRKERAKNWSIRCYLESLDHIDNSFITLTYDDAHNPGELVKKDLQKFIKALRRKHKVRYFACGEYGSVLNTHRPHYHILIFGFFPDDARLINSTTNLYTSKYLNDLWQKGFVSCGFVESASICYTARYTMKKMTDLYSTFEGQKEFILMSRRPGLGFNYVNEHLEELLNNEKLYLGKFGIKSFSRYIKDILNNYDPFRYSFIADKNAELAKDILNARCLKQGREEFVLKQDKAHLETIEKAKKRFL